MTPGTALAGPSVFINGYKGFFMKVFNSKFNMCVGAAVVTFFGHMPAVRANLVLEQQKVAPAAVETSEAGERER